MLKNRLCHYYIMFWVCPSRRQWQVDNSDYRFSFRGFADLECTVYWMFGKIRIQHDKSRINTTKWIYVLNVNGTMFIDLHAVTSITSKAQSTTYFFVSWFHYWDCNTHTLKQLLWISLQSTTSELSRSIAMKMIRIPNRNINVLILQWWTWIPVCCHCDKIGRLKLELYSTWRCSLKSFLQSGLHVVSTAAAKSWITCRLKEK